MTDAPAYSHDHVTRRLAATLRLYVGRGRPYSAESLAEATGIPERTIRSYRMGHATPGLVNLLALIRCLGGVFAGAILEDAGVAAVLLQDDLDTDPRELATRYERDGADELARLVAALEDGRIDHTEAPELLTLARRLMPMLAAFVRQHGSAP